MDIEQIKKEKQQLEKDMTAALSLLVDKFHEKCGISPSNICVSMIEVHQMCDPWPRYIVSDVSVTISI